MINIAIFASGSGTNFEAIMKHIQDGSLPVSCQCLIVDKSDAYCIRRAEKYKVQSFFVNPKRYASKEEYEMFCKFWPKSIAGVIFKFYSKGQNSNQL